MRSTNAQSGAPPKQQIIERHYFEMFQKAHPLPSGTIIYGDKPDVIIDGAQRIGVEITNFYVTDGSSTASEQVQRRRRSAAVAKAQREYELAGGKNFQLSVGFDKNHPIQDSVKLVERLVEFARRVEGRENGQVSGEDFEDIPELAHAHLYARELVHTPHIDPEFPNGQPAESEGFAAFAKYWNRREARALREGIYKPLSFTANWNVGQGHSFGLMSTARLAEIVREKEAKAKHYAPCDAYWLLVVVDFIDPAQEQEIRLDGGVDIVSDVFAKIIVYKTNFDHVMEITPRPTEINPR
jgi:hypothetical protein